ELSAQDLVRVGDQRKRKIMLFGKALMTFQGVARDPENATARLLEGRKVIAKGLALAGAAGRVVAGVEVDHQWLPEAVVELNGCAAGGFQRRRRKLDVRVA